MSNDSRYRFNASVSYSAPAAPGGSIILSGDQVSLSLTGVDIGVFVDPLTGQDAVLAKADFHFTGVIPEPNAAWLFAAGLLIATAAIQHERQQRKVWT